MWNTLLVSLKVDLLPLPTLIKDGAELSGILGGVIRQSVNLRMYERDK